MRTSLLRRAAVRRSSHAPRYPGSTARFEVWGRACLHVQESQEPKVRSGKDRHMRRKRIWPSGGGGGSDPRKKRRTKK